MSFGATMCERDPPMRKPDRLVIIAIVLAAIIAGIVFWNRIVKTGPPCLDMVLPATGVCPHTSHYLVVRDATCLCN